jgi:hypothetical protein
MKDRRPLPREFRWENFRGTSEPESPEATRRRLDTLRSFFWHLRTFFRALLEKATRYHEHPFDEEF